MSQNECTCPHQSIDEPLENHGLSCPIRAAKESIKIYKEILRLNAANQGAIRLCENLQTQIKLLRQSLNHLTVGLILVALSLAAHIVVKLVSA